MITIINNKVISQTDLKSGLTRLTADGSEYYKNHPDEKIKFTEIFKCFISDN